MKIAIVHAADFGGGAERSVLSLHKKLLESGHQCTLFVGDKRTDTYGVVQIPYVRGIPGTRRLARFVEQKTGWQDIFNPSFRNLSRLIDPDTDIIHFNSLWGSNGYADLGALPALTQHIPGIITERQGWLLTGHCGCFHGCRRWQTGCGSCPDLSLPPWISRDGTKFNWRRKRRLVARSRLTFVAISDWLKKEAELSPIWKGKKILRIYNGIDTKIFKPVSPSERSGIRERLGIRSTQKVVLIAGQTLEGYRSGIATEGYKVLNKLNRSDILPLLVGHTSTEAARMLHSPCMQLPFQSTPETMATCYQAADITLVTSKVEAFGRIPAESQACGTPVVAFDTAGLAEVVRNDVGGISVPNRDIAELARSLRVLADSEQLRRTLGEQGVEYVRNNFEETVIARQYVDLYDELVTANTEH